MTAIHDSTDVLDLRITPGVREVTSEDGAVLLDIEQGICFSLNPVGLKIWDLLKKKSSLDQIVDALAAEFLVPRDELRSDASEFIESLHAKHLLERADEPKPPKPGFLNSLLRRLHSARTARA
jgi:hypothetical protein